MGDEPRLPPSGCTVLLTWAGLVAVAVTVAVVVVWAWLRVAG